MHDLALLVLPWAMLAAAEQGHYYAHDAVHDENGVVAPWYTGQNGAFDYRVRIAAETLKRYPWTDASRAPAACPEYILNGHWQISPEGDITIPALSDWDNGDLGQRAAYVLSGFVDYYRYTGDAAAIAHMSLMADFLLDHCQTGPDHPWPRFLISVPTKGKPYGDADPHGMIQLDITAEVGLALLRAYQVTGNERWFDACKHWGDVLAAKRDDTPGLPPWNRYANPEDVAWEDQMTGGVAFLLTFFDELIRLGYRGDGDAVVAARDAGRAYLRDVLLPRWTVDDTWGRNYWDWPDPVQAENVTEFVARYLMEHPDVFPNWKNDVRNIVSLFLNRTSVSPASNGDVFSGAWAFPESSGCCGRSLWYGPMEISTVLAQYGVQADSAWARELARRMQILAVYDVHETGVVEDNIDGGMIVAGSWFKITHPMPLKHVLGTIAWLPEVEGANRENHIVRSGAVVSRVDYGKGRIGYTTFDAPVNTIDVLRLAFKPTSVTGDGQILNAVATLEGNGFAVRELPGGDCVVLIRHDGLKSIVVEGDDPQEYLPVSVAEANANMELRFHGNQARLIGEVAQDGGLADVYVDDVKQRVPVDCWNPSPRQHQVLYYINGLPNGEHRLKVIARGQGNPVSKGSRMYIEGLQSSSATGDAGYGAGGGPTGWQRMIFGYASRTDYIDSAGNAWRPATEWVCRAGALADVVKLAWWTERRRLDIAGTPDPELYRYGVHAPEFWTHVTVGPGTYHLRLKLAETRSIEPLKRALTVLVNGVEVVTDLDVAATAGGLNRAVDLVFNGIQPLHGTLEVRFVNRHGGEAAVQALEVGPGDGGAGANPAGLARVVEPGH